MKQENEMLRIEKLTKAYGKKQVLTGVNFVLCKGDIVGLLGPNGAGKSTMTKIIAGIEEESKGKIYYRDMPLTKRRSHFQKKLGVVPQEIALYEDLDAYDNVKFFGSLYGYSGEELKKRAKEVLEFVGLWEQRKELPSKFSGGMKRRLNIACSVIHSPELLIMDEPTVGIDPQSRNHIMSMIRTLRDRGTTVLYISHYIEEIEALCNRVIIMDAGNVVVDGEKEWIKEKYQSETCSSLEEIFLSLTGTELRDGVE